ncbi:uncharacterized protein LOC135823789 [Sycon ciliatum]|uniref:uncharacterized protein LOC135823789 n=1 Tax=Sycon ciliatum TaxID=27933 RepID=UPI0031F69FBF
MRRLWSICSRYQQPHYRISLTTECQEDIQWWLRLLEEWNGKSFFLFPDWTPSPDLELFTDASGTLGWGAFNSGRWLQGTWSSEQLAHSIEWKELYALVTACCTWGKEWRQLRITMHCDNKAVVDCIRSGTSKSPPVMTLIRELFFVCARFNSTVAAAHIAGQSNCIADSLSRFRMEEFRRLAPAAQAQPDQAVLPFQSMQYSLDIQTWCTVGSSHSLTDILRSVLSKRTSPLADRVLLDQSLPVQIVSSTIPSDEHGFIAYFAPSLQVTITLTVV